MVLLDSIIAETKGKEVSGAKAFELYDTYGFPIDLTALILSEKGYTLDEKAFQTELQKQKDRSRAAGKIEAGDWTIVEEDSEEVADAFGVNASLIRFWEKEFDVIKPKKNAKGNRKFTPEDIKNLELIYHLVKERGFTLEGAKTHLKENKQETINKFDLIRKLENIKAQLQQLKDQL